MTADPAFRCAGASVLRDEPLAGTASTVRAFLLVEHAGPWGVDALKDARLPDGLGPRIAAAAAAAKVRVLLVRRPGGVKPQPGQHTVLAAYADPVAPWLETGTVTDLHDVLDLDLAGLRAGRSVGLERTVEPVFAVCTHGRHDACCAEQGRPVAKALTQAHPEHTWEVSHIGGDRFAGNMVVLPHGLYYGRLDAPSALAVAAGVTTGEVELDHLRGRSGLPMPVQHAEIALRRDLGETRGDAVRFVRRTSVDDLTTAVFEVAGSAWEVVVRSARGSDLQRLTCRATRDNPVPTHEVVSIVRAQSVTDPPAYS